jgi:hypothetical protein
MAPRCGYSRSRPMPMTWRSAQADIVLYPSRKDAHQDHRLLGDLMPTVLSHLVLQYEIPTWDGDLGRPSAYGPLTEDLMRRKVELLDKHFRSQCGGTSSTRRYSGDWRGCAAWSAGRPTPRRSAATSSCCCRCAEAHRTVLAARTRRINGSRTASQAYRSATARLPWTPSRVALSGSPR